MSRFIKIIRPQQWVKNLFVFLPMFFGGSLTDVHDIINSLLTFFAFSCVASSVYCYNDIIDVDADRRHSVKCHRPIASGAVSVVQAYILMVFMLCLGIAFLLCLSDALVHTGMVVLGYYLLNLSYCTKLKQYAIIDVCVITIGFVLRILAGGFATEVVVSHWLILMTFLLTLFLSLAKRRDDVIRMNKTGEPPRKNTIRYNLTFINQAITITASVTLVCYIMYTVSPEVIARFHTQYLYLTSIFVVLGLLRYIQITVVDEKSGDPTKAILHDRFMQLTVIAWGLAFLFIIYL
ncbi:MAG: decaprenyl-phosphate phosphoribosyltransferase [Prevotella sp.]|nr:decaprenyl-phosphate phosphoribosyltransferase [Prevotella sp.]